MGPKSLYFATPFAFKLNPADGAVPYLISPESDISLKNYMLWATFLSLKVWVYLQPLLRSAPRNLAN